MRSITKNVLIVLLCIVIDWLYMDVSTSKVSQLLKESKAILKNKYEVENKLKALIEDGPEKLQIITDFDSTLTISHMEGEPTIHSIDVLNKVASLSKEFLAGCDSLFEKYNGLVYGSELSDHEKQRVLTLWWEGYVGLLSKEYITLDDVKQSTENINTPLRDNCDEMFSVLAGCKVPVIVVSAGIGDVVSHTLRDFQTKVVANFLKVGDEGRVLGFEDPHISVYNKHNLSLPVEASRHNVILMGDSLGDYNMADNVPNTKIVLKIGFCSKQDDAVLEKYQDRFDIVLVEDQTMNVPISLLKQIVGS